MVQVRAVAAIAALFLCCALVESTHFRYGHFQWEKVLPSPSGEFKVKLLLDAGGRWGFAYTTVTPSGTTPVACPNGNCCAGTPVAGDAPTSGSCPPVGRYVNFNGGGAGWLNFDKPVKIHSLHNVAVANPVFMAGPCTCTSTTVPPTCPCQTTFDVLVNTINPTVDLFYGQFVAEISWTIANNPLKIWWAQSARISTLLEGNNDQPWRLEMIIDASVTAGTKSPKSTSLPLINVVTGVVNDIFIPTVAFDNFVNKFRISTTAESLLVFPTPRTDPNNVPPLTSTFALDANNQGLVHFKPGASGPYAVQFMITSFEGAVAHNSVPLDFIFMAAPQGNRALSLSAPPNGDLVKAVNVGQQLQFTIEAVMTPLDGTYTVTINNTPLPTGATVSQPACTGGAVCVKTFTWTPTLQSASAVVCFQGVGTFNTLTVTSAGMLCININIGALQTTMFAFPASGSCGGPTYLEAKLLRTVDSAAIIQRPISFALDSDLNTLLCTPSPLTNNSGTAQCIWVPAHPINPPQPYRATFTAIVNEFLQSSSAVNLVVTKTATTSLNNPKIPPLVTDPKPTVGFPLFISAVLNRIFTDGGLFAPPGEIVVFSSDIQASPVNGLVAGLQGVATATFPSPSVTGTFSVSAFFAGSDCLIGPASSGSSSFTVFERAQLVLSPITAVCGQSLTITARLTRVVGGTGVGSMSVNFNYGAGNVPATTDANGFASVTTSFALPSSQTVTVSWTPINTFTNRNGFLAAETDTIPSFTVSQASSAFDPLSVTPATTIVINTAVTVSSVLRRVVTPLQTLNGVSVTFTLTRNSPAPVVNTPQTATTNGATGAVSTIFAAGLFAQAGSYSVVVTYNPSGAGCPAGTTSAVVPITVVVLTPTVLTLNPFSGTCGTPTTVTARLREQPTLVAISGRLVTITIVGGATICSTTTDSNGDVTCAFTPGAQFSGNYRADFAGVPNIYDVSTATATFTIVKAGTALTSFSLVNNNFIGDQIDVVTRLSRTSVPVGVITGVTVTFVLTGAAGNPGGPTTSSQNVVTDSNGDAKVTYDLNMRGSFTITASYIGTTCVNSVTRSASISVYQKTFLFVNEAFGDCGALTQVVAGLHGAATLNMPIANQQIDFSFTGNPTPATASGTTNSQGTAFVSVNFPQAGDFIATASFANLAAYFVDSSGNPLPTSSQSDVHIAKSFTSLDDVTVAPSSFVGDTVSFNTILTRTTAPVGVVSLAPLHFVLTGPAGPSTKNQNTDANGAATQTFTLTARGPYTIAVNYDGTSCLETASTSKTFNTYQKAQLTLTPVSATCGAPVTLTATLVTVSGAVGIPNQNIVFDFGGVLTTTTVTTNSNGVATFSAVFPDAGSFSVVTTFVNVVDYFADRNGVLGAETSSIIVNTAHAVTSLSNVPAASNALVAGSLTFSSTLTRADSIAVGVQTVAFDLNGPVSDSHSVSSSAAGLASTSFTFTDRGSYSVKAKFAGGSCLNAAASNLGAIEVYQATALSLSASYAGTCGAAISVTAQLLTVPGGVAVSGQAISFSFFGVVDDPPLATTDGSGFATVNVVYPNAGAFSVRASFINAADHFTNHFGAIPPNAETSPLSPVIVTAAATSLSDLVVPTHAYVGAAFTVTSVLSRADFISVSAGLPVVFTFTLPGGSTVDVPVNTAADGSVSASYTPTVRGPHSVTAAFAADSCLVASNSNTATLNAYQRTSIAIAPASGNCGSAVTVSATLTAVPGGALISSQSVSFDFQGAFAPASQTAITSAGVASVVINVAQPTTLSATASFSNVADYFADTAGAFIAETDTNQVVFVTAATLVSDVTTGPENKNVDSPLVVFSTLSRVDALAVGGGFSIVFTMTAPGGAQTMLSDDTDGSGLATVSFVPTTRGVHTFVASFAGGSCLGLASSINSLSASVYQRTSLSLAPASGACDASIQLSATLLTVPGGAAVDGQTINFNYPVSQTGSATTSGGVATITISIANANSYTASASFLNGAGFFTGPTQGVAGTPVSAATASNNIVVASAATSLSITSTPSSALVDGPLVVKASLTRPDGLNVNAGLNVVFTLTDPLSGTTQLTGTTVAGPINGEATVTFTPTKRGVHTVSAAFFVGTCLLASNSINTVNVPVYQAARVDVASLTAICSNTQTVTATLITVPGGVAINGQQISFSFVGPNAPTSQTATTGGGGTASVSFFTAIKTAFTAQVSFSNGGNFFTNRNGVVPAAADTSSAPISITFAPTTLVVAGASQVLVSTSSAYTATLSVSGAPASLLNNAALSTTLSGPAAPQNSLSNANAGGEVSATFAFNTRGAFTATATFAGDLCLAAVTSAGYSVNAYQRAKITVEDQYGQCGGTVDLQSVIRNIPVDAPVYSTTVVHTVHYNVDSRHFTVPTDNTGFALAAGVSFPNSGVYDLLVDHSSFALDFYTSETGDLFPPRPETDVDFHVNVQTSLPYLDSLTINGQPDASFITTTLGQSLTVSTTVRVQNPDGVLSNVPASLAILHPDFSQDTIPGSTDINGLVAFSVDSSYFSARGDYVLWIEVAAGACVSGTTSNFALLTVLQKSSLSLGAITGSCGVNIPISAHLTAIPGGFSDVSGWTIMVTTDNNAASAFPLDPTNVLGDATGTLLVGPSAGTHSFQAVFDAFSTAGDSYWTDASGVQGAVTSISVSNVVITRSLPAFQVVDAFPATTVPLGTAMQFRTIVQYASQSTPIGNVQVAFLLVSPSLATYTHNAGLTDPSSGEVFSPDFVVTELGTWEVRASVQQDGCILAATSDPIYVDVFQNQGVGNGDKASAVNSAQTTSTATHGLSTGAVVALAVIPSAVAVLVAVYVWRRCVQSKRENAAKSSVASAARTSSNSKPNEKPNPMVMAVSVSDVNVTVDAAV